MNLSRYSLRLARSASGTCLLYTAMENKENVTIIDIDNALLDIEVLAERVQVMVNDVDQDYFNVDIEKTGEMLRIAPPFYTTAGIKTCLLYKSSLFSTYWAILPITLYKHCSTIFTLSFKNKRIKQRE